VCKGEIKIDPVMKNALKLYIEEIVSKEMVNLEVFGE